MIYIQAMMLRSMAGFFKRPLALIKKNKMAYKPKKTNIEKLKTFLKKKKKK